jgi:hypothetical protein
MSFLSAFETQLQSLASIHFFFRNCIPFLSRIEFHWLWPIGIFLVTLLSSIPAVVVAFLLQLSLLQTIVYLDRERYHCLEVIRSISPDYVVLDVVFKSSIILSRQRIVVPVNASHVLLEFRCVSSSWSRLSQVLDVSLGCAFLIDVAKDAVDPVLEPRKAAEDDFGFLVTVISLWRWEVFCVVRDEYFDPVEGCSSQERRGLEDLQLPYGTEVAPARFRAN